MSYAFLIKLSGTLDNFVHRFPGMWDYFWDLSPGLLENIQKNFPGMSDEFWKVFPELLKTFVENKYTESMLCINYPRGNVCGGDSGGPLVTKPAGSNGVSVGENYEQIGVTSFILDVNCTAPSLTVYGRVTSILDWIKQTMGKGHTDCHRK